METGPFGLPECKLDIPVNPCSHRENMQTPQRWHTNRMGSWMNLGSPGFGIQRAIESTLADLNIARYWG